MKPFIPLTVDEQQLKANEIARKTCSGCHKDYETGCKECIWYLILNAMIGEEEF
jgi:hypothetical protein